MLVKEEVFLNMWCLLGDQQSVLAEFSDRKVAISLQVHILNNPGKKTITIQMYLLITLLVLGLRLLSGFCLGRIHASILLFNG